ncbi:endonuclease/exonuclease/phosphatase family protein [Streptomyces sp. NPDC001709]
MRKTLCAASRNIQKNGRRLVGGDDRPPSPSQILQAYTPDLVFRQELTGAAADGHRVVFAEATAVGRLFPCMADEHKGRSRNPTGVMVNPRRFEIAGHTNHDLPLKQLCHVQVRRPSKPRTLHPGSQHLCHFDFDMRATEARRATSPADGGNRVLLWFDGNSYVPGDVASLDWDTGDDPVHVQQRTSERDGQRVSDTRPMEILTHGRQPVFIDLADHAATTLTPPQPQALKPTASLHRTDQGPPQRIDWLLGTPDVASALVKVEVIDTADVRRRTDHALLFAWSDLDMVDDILSTP